jgi:hypothetical protein
MESQPENNESLWILTLAPGIWAAHFLFSYLSASIWCARLAGPDASLATVRAAIAAYTIVALVGIVVIGRVGYRRHGHGFETRPHDLDSPRDRHRFLGFATLLLAGLSGVATIFVALPAFFIESCR